MVMTGNNHSRSKQLNKTLILKTVMREGPLSRLNIAKITKLTPATITNLTAELIEDGIIIESGDTPSNEKARAGRKSIALDLNHQSHYAIGIHIRPDRIEAGIVNLKGQVVEQYSFPFDELPNHNELLNLLLLHIQTILAEHESFQIIGIGIASIGLIDFSSGEIVTAKNMGWDQVKVVDYLSSLIPIPVYLDNNVTTMALAEKLFGRAKQTENFIFIYVGRGIGSGLVSNNEINRRGRAGSGEFGHMTYDPEGEACWCGNHGCLEIYASGRALLKEFNMTGLKLLINSALQGNEDALSAIRHAGEKIGTCMASFNNIFYIDKAIIGGQLAREDLPFVSAIREAFYQRSFLATSIDPVEIYSSDLRDDVGIIGGASLAFNEYFF